MVRVGLLFALILGSILECPGQEAGVTGRTASLAPILEVLAKENSLRIPRIFWELSCRLYSRSSRASQGINHRTLCYSNLARVIWR